jgi:hypothetical protein
MASSLLHALDQFICELGHIPLLLSLHHRSELTHDLLLGWRQIFPACLRVDEKQIQWTIAVVVKVDDTDATALADPAALPPDLTNTAALRNHIASFGISGDKIHELNVLVFVPNIRGLPCRNSGVSATVMR